MTRHSPEEPVTISLILPVYNEAGNLADLCKKLDEVLEPIGDPVELVFIDDGSSDSSWQTLLQLSTTRTHVKLLRFSRNFGKEAAIYAGLECCSGQAAVVMDADLQHPPELVLDMVQLWREQGVKVVHAVKEQRQPESLLRRLPARGFYWLMNVLSGYNLKGATDFKLLDRAVINHYLALPETVRFFRGLIPWLGFQSATVHFTPGQRRFGKSGWPTWSLIRTAVRAICAFSSIPMQIVTVLGALTFVGALILGLDTLYMKWSGRAVEGFTTVIILLLSIGSVLMVSFGLIGQYLAMIYEEIKGRPSFIIERFQESFPEPNKVEGPYMPPPS